MTATPTKLPNTNRTPVRQADPAEPVRKKVRTRKGTGTDRLHIPQEIIPDGIDLQWVTDSVLGQPAMQTRIAFEVNAWEPVLPSMFDGRFDGMFMPKGHKGEINVDGLVLMWRPMELTMEARAEERQAARGAVVAQEAKLRGGNLDGVTLDTQHASVRANTRLTREIIPGMPIPNN